ncbi:hypothetical protein Y1Q_0023128 [Alligator mississippiensis]|nr:hypothetical protein Y1Q_0023128 [Alligator mississippiensis]
MVPTGVTLQQDSGTIFRKENTCSAIWYFMSLQFQVREFVLRSPRLSDCEDEFRSLLPFILNSHSLPESSVLTLSGASLLCHVAGRPEQTSQRDFPVLLTTWLLLLQAKGSQPIKCTFQALQAVNQQRSQLSLERK